MVNLDVKYMGLDLKSPIIVGACDLSRDIQNINSMKESGAGAIVYKSLFQEQVELEKLAIENIQEDMLHIHPEMTNPLDVKEVLNYNDHLAALKKIKKEVEIPLIASINALEESVWIEYAKNIEKVGVDAIELNFYMDALNANLRSCDIEDMQISILKNIKKEVKIPVSVKMSYFYTNPLNFAKKLEEAGANGLVLFNRLFHPDINIYKEEMSFAMNLTHSNDSRMAIRFIGSYKDETNTSLCASCGIHNSRDVIRAMLSGANAVQVVSTLYKNSINQIHILNKELINWMKEKEYEKPSDFIGKLSKDQIDDPYAYRRAQYVNMLMKPYSSIREELFL